jgi:hypothetical protein
MAKLLMTTIRVNVTYNHIDKGIAGDPGLCPIALALRDKGYKYPSVGHILVSGLRERSIRMPREVIDWINDFDSDILVEPISFELQL